MPNLRFSDELVQNELIGNTGLGSITNGFKSNVSAFYMMQGTIPSQSQFDNAVAGFRNTDKLWTDTVTETNTTLGSNTISMSYREKNATKTGTATWFFWEGNTSGDSSTPASRILGSISITGGSGDLTMADVSIVDGQPYSIGPIILTIPASYTYT